MTFQRADILLPKFSKDSDAMKKWSVVACDQYTSEPEYWDKVRTAAADKPSALNVVLPEVYLTGDNSKKIDAINAKMHEYLNNKIFTEYTDSAHLLIPNHWYHIELSCINGRVQYIIDGNRLVDYIDPSPLTSGWFGFRTTWSRAQITDFSYTTE